MRDRTPERIQFLSDLLIGAIEHAGYGFPHTLESKLDAGTDSYAVIVDRYELDEDDEEIPDSAPRFRIDLDTIATGLSLIRRALVVTDGTDSTEPAVYANPDTFERLYLGDGQRKNILLSDRTNGDDGDMDVIDHLAVLEIALFGAVTYA